MELVWLLSGLSQTPSTGCQFRMALDHHLGFLGKYLGGNDLAAPDIDNHVKAAGLQIRNPHDLRDAYASILFIARKCPALL